MQLETVPGVAEVASIGGFVRQYQVQLDPNKLLRLRHSAFDGHRPRSRRAPTKSAAAFWI